MFGVSTCSLSFSLLISWHTADSGHASTNVAGVCVLTSVACGLDINGCVLSYLRDSKFTLFIQAVHSLLYIVAKCNFFSVVTWKDIITYLQKVRCEVYSLLWEYWYIYITIYIYILYNQNFRKKESNTNIPQIDPMWQKNFAVLQCISIIKINVFFMFIKQSWEMITVCT